ncbi:Cof-type HAD-IIB family hydrolase [Paucisalibacillus globulus]|uniref:Cof-type HAD-IIB family hydrolase n=1 Tax=Paucisalibacillus globulus TaxID=351095 RepID=UPI00040ADF4B|nr:Cof-type HAD-IIB family hydrolase [Paucisalibacillus globulus]
MKLIAIDLDGTTVNSKKEISKENIEAIKKAQEQGHIVMALSGRAINGIKPELDKYGLNCHIGANNGASLYVDDNLLHMTFIKSEHYKRISLELEKEFVPFNMSTNNGVFAPRNWDERVEKVISSGAVPKENLQHRHYEMLTRSAEKKGHNLFDDVEDVVNDESIEVQKFLIVTLDPKQKERIEQFLSTIEEIGVASSTLNIDIMNKDANKGTALKCMADHYNIPLEDTVAIGDDSNDITMFQMAGLSIAMENASDEVKEYSDVVTFSNDEHGVAYAIHKYVLDRNA